MPENPSAMAAYVRYSLVPGAERMHAVLVRASNGIGRTSMRFIEVVDFGIVPDRLLWSTVVLLPKGDGGHRGIGLLEPLWKAISSQTHESN